MNIMGMGTLELLAVLLIGFIFLGPNRLVDVARLLGKASREAKRLTDDLPELLLKDEKSIDDGNDEDIKDVTDVTSDEDSAPETRPIAFKRSNRSENTTEIKDTKTREG